MPFQEKEQPMATLVTGVFHQMSDASLAIERLRAAGFTESEISVLAPDSTRRDAFAVKTGSKVGEGAAVGAGVGGATVGLIAGLTAVGAIASGGLGLLAAGPAVAALAGLGAGAVTGGLIGGMVGLGIPEHEAKFYEGEIEKGGTLICVRAEGERRETAQRIFRECRAETVSKA
jgi:hypothetical protein